MMDTSEPAETPARRAVRRRSEFVAAFVEHAGPVPVSERRTVTLPTLITVTAIVSLTTVIAGVFWSLIKGDSTSSSAGKSTATPSYSEFAGWGCAGASDHGFEAHGRTKQWRTVAEGGWSGNGCNSTFETIPMSGKAAADTGRQFVQWWFVPTTGGQCKVQVYVPKSTSQSDTGATAVHFAVMAGRTGAAYADFTIDEAGNTGRWVDGGSFPPHGSELAVRLTDRGVPQRAGDRIAISAVRVTCGA
jgi:Cleaved Adhesin Domain